MSEDVSNLFMYQIYHNNMFCNCLTTCPTLFDNVYQLER